MVWTEDEEDDVTSKGISHRLVGEFFVGNGIIVLLLLFGNYCLIMV